MAPVIRQARPADAPALARLRFEFRAGLDASIEPEQPFVERCRSWMADRLSGSAWRCWLVEASGGLVGSVWLQLLEKMPNPVGEPELHGYVTNLYVRAEFRGAGVGSALLERCLAECRSRGADAVFLWPTPRSRSLYERHGFTVREDLLERRLERPPAHALFQR